MNTEDDDESFDWYVDGDEFVLTYQINVDEVHYSRKDARELRDALSKFLGDD